MVDASPPSSLRLTGFLLTVVGALLLGVGSLLTWVTVGLAGQSQLDSVTVGVDILDGKLVLACAVILLLCVLATRMATEPTMRTALAAAIVVGGVVAASVAVVFLVTAHGRFDPVSNDDLIQKLATALQAPVDTVREQLRATLEALGGFTRVGIGPAFAIAGGILAGAGGAVTILWTRRTPAGGDEQATVA
jgi:Tryptophan-associated transmembrane protein (Trp_oprn_chp)